MLNLYLRRLTLTAVFGIFSLPLLFAATIVVTSTADAGPGSLRDAVGSAVAGDVIRFGSATLREPIVLSSEILIDKPLTLRGNGMGNTIIDGGGTTRAFRISGAGNVYIGILTIRNCATAVSGGAIQNMDGILFLDGMEITTSTAAGAAATEGGGAVHNMGNLQGNLVRFIDNSATGAAGNGGAILNSPGGTFNITGGRFSGNTASRAGGAIEDNSGSGTSRLVNCTMLENSTGPNPGNGGGVHITGGANLVVIGGSYTNNTAAREGGALWNGSGIMHVINAFVDNNEANGPAADDGGGGIFNNGGTLNIRPGTVVSNNRALGTAGSGGGVFNAPGGRMQVIDATIKNNSANRAGGGIEDIGGANGLFVVTNSAIDSNEVFTSPGNGGGIHIGGSGNLSITGGTVNGNKAGAEGGGIWVDRGLLEIEGVTISGNEASGNAANQGGGGLYNNEGGGRIVIRAGTVITDNHATGTLGSGGGILVDEDSGLTITGASIMRNTANRAGGGIEDVSGDSLVTVLTSTRVDSNEVFNSPGNGGGIHVGGNGSVNFVSGTVNGNIAGSEGGGIWIATGTLTLGGSVVIDGNTAEGNDADQGGGGLYSNGGGTMVLTPGVTITNNSATGTSGSGGGILNHGGATLQIDSAIIMGNTANRAGGGIEDISGDSSEVMIINAILSNNEVFNAPGNGGGLHVGGNGSVTIRGGQVNENRAGQEGGGLWNNVGTMRVIGVEVDGNIALGVKADDGGGGLFNNGGTMILEDVEVTNNAATGTAGSGGGLFSTAGAVTVTGGNFFGNSSNRAGGAVEQVDGSYTSIDVTYRSNVTGRAPGNGGAFHVTGTSSTSSFTGGMVMDNFAGNEGAGLWNQSGMATMTVENVSIFNNTVNGTAPGDAGGGIFNNGGIVNVTGSTIAFNTVAAEATAGAGIFNRSGGVFTLTASTVSSNMTGGAGGGITNDGTMSIVNSTITQNTAAAGGGIAQAFEDASLDITGTIVADNFAGIAPDFVTAAAAVNSGGYNLIGDDIANEFPAVGTDIEGGNANLGPLANNGGTTLTHAPTCPSDAVGNGNPADASPDQAGQSPDGTRDIGAIELIGGCSNFTDGLEQPEGLALANNLHASVQLFPNPTALAMVNISIPAELEGEVVLRVFDANGRVRGERRTQAGSVFQLPLEDLPNGTYSVQVISGETSSTHRLLIVR
ncbi:choice-of-anchor Q domain-containing protein [Neolewinella lacunae]|uniref:T9SS type A sorting domain-containing protein n=1 Tax=Neolewinella lacunae TaxID=1517758 RepID=A0A923PHG3_9BACT|nr:choice-of-anchor Q domain-containing protein [Neolewinella lacunae]MBC6994142.1 T9SS type A sorting domain-containing protein [Neolewinella lacunae]MDN3636709.1 choice-of-anchor Q domain-containing protein [Neolewinella lacunae]